MWQVYEQVCVAALDCRKLGMADVSRHFINFTAQNSESRPHIVLLTPQVGKKKGNVLFNDALNTFYFTVIWCLTYGKGLLR